MSSSLSHSCNPLHSTLWLCFLVTGAVVTPANFKQVKELRNRSGHSLLVCLTLQLPCNSGSSNKSYVVKAVILTLLRDIRNEAIPWSPRVPDLAVYDYSSGIKSEESSLPTRIPYRRSTQGENFAGNEENSYTYTPWSDEQIQETPVRMPWSRKTSF